MVTVSGYAVRHNQDGEAFVVIILQGDMEIIQSQRTGHFYATSRKCTLSSTFSEQMAATLVGKQLPDAIIKEECDPYDFVVRETGEIQELTYCWIYVADDSPQRVKADLNVFSRNGSLGEA